MSPDLPLSEALHQDKTRRTKQIYSAEIQLLYQNANLGIWVTAVAVPILGYLQWAVISSRIVLGWSIYMLVVSALRYALTFRYERTSSAEEKATSWGAAFIAGAGLSGAGWGAAGILLYPADLSHQVFLIFVLGGMMLGAASLLAPRPAAFLVFLLPAGIATSVRLMLQGDHAHLAMGLLAVVFTITCVTTTWNIYQTIASALQLRFENHDLVDELRTANHEADLLNQQLENRVRERTLELQEAAERLRAEIEQRVQMEEELLRARKLESLGVLAGGIAHDFNNFLTVVQGNVDLAKMQLHPDDPVMTILERATSGCQRAAFLSSQLLTFAKGGKPIRRVVSIAKLVQDAVDLARAGAPTSINLDISNDLWFAEVDADQIGQVLHNILLNARQSMPEGGIVEVRAINAFVRDRKGADSSDFVRITIRDYGCGISADVLPRIFDPYFTTKGTGTGLGLATAYSIVSKHAGHIAVESTPGRGTVFTVDLPASREVPQAPPSVSDRPQRGTGKLLVMDDEEGIRILLKAILTNLGYEVHCAGDGAHAIALYEAAKASGVGFDAVLLDLTVSGGMGGVEAAARLKELDSSAKLIVSSGYSQAAVMSDYRRYGFDAVIEKPWVPTQIREVFRAVLCSEGEPQARRTNDMAG